MLGAACRVLSKLALTVYFQFHPKTQTILKGLRRLGTWGLRLAPGPALVEPVWCWEGD